MGLISVVLFISLASTALGGPLDDYINLPDPAYNWDLVSSSKGDGYTVYFINMTSQAWLTSQDSSSPIWYHWLAVCIPDQILPFDTATLWINGGSNGNFASQMKFDSSTQALCIASGMVTASLYQTPNQPIVFNDDPTHQSRTEDAIVAYTWSHFLNHTNEPFWLLHLPMTKAAVRALDTIQAFLPTLSNANIPKINNFAVLGASKRGWTSWLTAAVDARVKIFIPIVIPVLDLVNSLNRLFQPYGEWSFILADYLNNGIMNRLNTPEMQLLASIEDPFAYAQRYLNKPFYIIDAAEDEFFLPDSTSVFWSKFSSKFQKLMKLIPKTDHFLKGYEMEVVNNVNTFIQMNLRNQPMPNFSWKMLYMNDSASIIASVPQTQPGSAKLDGVYLWYADSLSTTQRDFRMYTCAKPSCFNAIVWNKQILNPVNGVYSTQQSKPSSGGWRAFFIEAVFTFDWSPMNSTARSSISVTTETNIVPTPMPFPPCQQVGKC